MRKKMILIVAMMGIVAALQAQILHPVKWAYAAKKVHKDEAVLFFRATIEPSWHIYSVDQKEGGPVKTSFAFTPSKDYNLIGTISEPKPVTKYEKAFGMDVNYFEHTVTFQQKVKLKPRTVAVNGSLNFMICNANKCLPPETVSFEIPIK